MGFPGGTVLRVHPPVMQELRRVPSLGQEGLLEKETATHASVLAWETPRTEEPGGLRSTGWKELDTTQRLSTHIGFD